MYYHTTSHLLYKQTGIIIHITVRINVCTYHMNAAPSRIYSAEFLEKNTHRFGQIAHEIRHIGLKVLWQWRRWLAVALDLGIHGKLCASIELLTWSCINIYQYIIQIKVRKYLRLIMSLDFNESWNKTSIQCHIQLLKISSTRDSFFQTKNGIILSHRPFHKTMLIGSLAPLFLAIMDEWEEKNLELQVDMRISWMVQIIIFVIKKYTVIPVMSFLLTEPYLPVFTVIGSFTSLLAVQSTYHHRRPICS